jgi:hypothetical protein
VIVEWATDHGDAPRAHHRLMVSTGAELDAVLDRVQQRGVPQMVELYHSDDPNAPAWQTAGLQVGLGHGERAFVWFTDGAGAAFGYEDDLAELAHPITFDYGGVPTSYTSEQTRVRPVTARKAAHEFLRGGTRPGCVSWPA